MAHPFVTNRIHRFANELQAQSARLQFAGRFRMQLGFIHRRSTIAKQNLEPFLLPGF